MMGLIPCGGRAFASLAAIAVVVLCLCCVVEAMRSIRTLLPGVPYKTLVFVAEKLRLNK